MATRDASVVQVDNRTGPNDKPIANRVLSALPLSEFHLLRPSLEYVQLNRHDMLHEPDGGDAFIYFPNSGLLSLVVVAEDGRTVEAGIAGKEGIVGLASAVGLSKNPLREVVQISGDGFRIPVTAMRKALRVAPDLQMALSRYAVLYGLQVSQTAACNRLHAAEKRLARWLLMSQDRVETSTIRMTHDFLATMLGTDRPTISLAAADLQKKQMIRYLRGSVKILDRKKLELFACECYGVVKQYNVDLGLK